MNTDALGNLQDFDWVAALLAGLSESDQMIADAALQDGWKLVNHRGRVIREAMHRFFEQVVLEAPPRGSLAIHALGGTGRQEICPGSDVDVGILVENIEENDHFLRHVSHRLRQFAPFVPGLRPVVKANAFPDLKDADYFNRASLASLMDGDLLVGDAAFDQRIRRLCRERASQQGLEFIFAINRDLEQFDEMYPEPPGHIGGFHVKNGKGGLRYFQMTMWLYAFERWLPCSEVYQQARNTRRFDMDGAPTPQVLDAVGIIFAVRCWVEQRRAAQRAAAGDSRPANLVLDVADMEAFRSRFGARGVTQMTRAREIICSYRHETLDRLLERGVVVPDSDGLIVWGTNGLRVKRDALFRDATEMFYLIYRAGQRFGLPIDQSVKRAARKNIAESLRLNKAFVQQLVAPGSVFPTLNDWFEFGVLDKLVPGFSRLTNRLYQPGHRTATLTLAARAMQRVENLERLAAVNPASSTSQEAFFAKQYRELGDSARGALRLALLTEEIPQTLYGENQPYAGSASRYVHECLTEIPGMSGPTLRTIEFLLLMKRELLKASEMSDQTQVLEGWLKRICDLKSRDAADTIRALALFACAAFDFHSDAQSNRARLDFEQWHNVQNLTQNLLYYELGVTGRPFDIHYFDHTGQRIAKLLPRRLLASPHVDNSLKQNYDGDEVLDPHRAHRIINALKEVVQMRRPKVMLARDVDYCRLTLFAWDFRGLFWRVAGALYELGCSLRSTDLYGIPDPDGRATDGESLLPDEPCLIFDAISFDPPNIINEFWEDEVRRRVLHRLEHPDEPLPDNTHEILAPVMETLSPELTDLGGGRMKFSCHAPLQNKGTRYAISRLLSERTGADIESIVRDGTRDWPIPRTNFYIRLPLDIQSAAAALKDDLGNVAVAVDTL